MKTNSQRRPKLINTATFFVPSALFSNGGLYIVVGDAFCGLFPGLLDQVGLVRATPTPFPEAILR